MITSIVVAFVAGGGGVWYSYPTHQQQLHEQARLMTQRIRTLERRMVSGVVDKKHLLAAKISELLRRSDKNGDGLDDSEKRSAGDAIMEQLQEMEDENGTFAKETLVVIGCLGVLAMVALVAHLCFNLWKRKRAVEQIPKGVLKLRILGCTDLPNVDVTSKDPKDLTDAHVEATLGSQRKKTETVANNLNPTFKGDPLTFKVDLTNQDQTMIHLRVADGRNGILSCGAEQAIGTALLNVFDFAADPLKEVARSCYVTIDPDVPNPENKHPMVDVSGVYTPSDPKYIQKVKSGKTH